MADFDADPFEELGSWLLRLKNNVLDSDQEELSVRLEKFLCQEREAKAMGNEETTKLDEGTLRTPTTSSRSMNVEVLCPRCRREEAKEAVQRALRGRRVDSLVLQQGVVGTYSTVCVEADIWLSEINKIENEDPGSRRTTRNVRVQTDDMGRENPHGLPKRARGSRRTTRNARIRTDDIERKNPQRRIRGRASGRGIEQVASRKEATERQRRRTATWTDYLIHCIFVCIISLVIVYLVIIDPPSERSIRV